MPTRSAATSEDCLTLNIWAPEHAENAPVFVWIYGGALTSGVTRFSMYDGAALARQGLVVVSINYRLGVLGYLAHPGLSAESTRQVSGNYGLLDQIAALRWINRNITSFGGDPSQVTIAGESAGALSVMYLMASPHARGLFPSAIAQSAYMLSTPALRETSFGTPSAEAVGAGSRASFRRGSIADLRAMDPQESPKPPPRRLSPVGTDRRLDPAPPARRHASIAASRRRSRSSPASTRARSARCASSLPPAPADAQAYEAAIRTGYGDLADEPSASTRPAISSRACSRRRATRCTAGPPSGWPHADGARPGRLPLLSGTTAILPPTRPACTPSMPASFLLSSAP